MARQQSDLRVLLVPDHQECVVWCFGRKISFICTRPVAYEMQWDDLHGNVVDDRLSPPLPNMEPLRPLPPTRPRPFCAGSRISSRNLSSPPSIPPVMLAVMTVDVPPTL